MISSLHVYPVKGCAAVDIEAIEFDPQGLVIGDRVAVIVDPATGKFISQRHIGGLAQLRAALQSSTMLELTWQHAPTESFARPANATPIEVTVWDDTFTADDGGDDAARWLSERLARTVRLAWLRGPSGRTVDSFWAGEASRMTSFADLAPMLVTNVASLNDLNARRAESGRSAIEMMRFRPNVVVSGLSAFEEDAIAELRGEETTIRFIKPCARCSVIELDPHDGLSTNDEVLRSLAGFRTLQNRRGTRGVMFGQNAIAAMPARRLRVGDRLQAVRRSPEVA